MRDALAKRELQATLDMLEAFFGSESVGKKKTIALLFRAAEKALAEGKMPDARAAVGELVKTRGERLDAAQVEAGMAESAELAKGRGVETLQASNDKPATRDGFLWLARKNKLSPSRKDAGQRYAKLYAGTRTDGVRSCLDVSPHASATSPGACDARQRDQRSLNAVNRHIRRAVGEDQGAHLIGLLEAVCGQGWTLRELAKTAKIEGDHDRRTARLEADLMIALDMVSAHLGLVRVAA